MMLVFGAVVGQPLGMDPAGLPALVEAIRHMHGCVASLVKSVPVREIFKGQVVWDGEVQVFNLADHPTASRLVRRIENHSVVLSQAQESPLRGAPAAGSAQDQVELLLLVLLEVRQLVIDPEAHLALSDPLREYGAVLEEVEEDAPAGDLGVTVTSRVVLPGRPGRPCRHRDAESPDEDAGPAHAAMFDRYAA